MFDCTWWDNLSIEENPHNQTLIPKDSILYAELFWIKDIILSIF